MRYDPLRELPAPAGWGPGDVLVVFGELFGRGYANGIVDEARRVGMTLVGATVGRRDGSEGPLRPLSAEELAAAEANLGGRIVNVPLEAGFDLEAVDGGPSPAEQLKRLKGDNWRELGFDQAALERSRAAGAARFERNAAAFAAELATLVPPGANLLVVHTMAGGVPRARSLLPLMTRLFRGTGEKHLASAEVWASPLGQLWASSFEEVTARTFQRLVAATAPLRTPGRRVRYVAYGYHGCEVLIGGRLTWQSYTPYLQGWAKMGLEQHAEAAWKDGVKATVFNAPEIWTNSSALFSGVELSLYPLLLSVRQAGAEAGGAAQATAEALWAACRALLKEGATLEAMLERAERFLASPALAPFRSLEAWPQHSTREEMEVMLPAAEEVLAFSADAKNAVAGELSRVVFGAVGRLMLAEAWEPSSPVRWLNHDVIARRHVRP
ncbi:MAG: hypothetical protein IPO09_22090 [Anaeromyxobacter sp.]|nr:hypothetical protein [Anaeromyxobacter sp.]